MIMLVVGIVIGAVAVKYGEVIVGKVKDLLGGGVDKL